jgi:acyl-CoA:acyl-CoA alkyltransferase
VSANSVYRLANTSVVSVVAVEAPEVITSASFDDQLEPTLERLGLRRGMLEQVAGIKERRWWPEGVTYSEMAAEAGRQALDAAGISADQVGLLIDTSVCRARLEPSTACNLPAR